MAGDPMWHDWAAENGRRTPSRYGGCTCPATRYTPRHPKPTDPECPTHGGKQ